jgi:hypothetical protein
MGARLMAGQQTLDLFVEVRILCPQQEKSLSRGFLLTFYRLGEDLTNQPIQILH